jgi:preprotein translocase subunit SecY
VVFIEQGQRRIPVQFAKRVVGRKMYGGQSTYIPLKVNQAGVIPIIFASAVLNLPVLLSARCFLPTAGVHRSRASSTMCSVDLHTRCTWVLRPADHRVRILLHGDRVRPGSTG